MVRVLVLSLVVVVDILGSSEDVVFLRPPVSTSQQTQSTTAWRPFSSFFAEAFEQAVLERRNRQRVIVAPTETAEPQGRLLRLCVECLNDLDYCTCE